MVQAGDVKMTEILFNGKEVVKAEFHVSGQLMWIRFILKDGTRYETYVFQGSV